MRLQDGTRKSDKLQLLTRTCTKPTNKLVSTISKAPLVPRQAMGNSGLTRLTTAQTRGKPPPSPIQYSLCLPAAPTSEWLFVPKLPRFGLSQLCGTIILCSDLRLGQGLKRSCSSCRELSNVVLHSSCTHRGWVDSRLLVVRSQTPSLTPALSFCPNLCWRCSNDSCEPIFNIYTSISF